MSEAWPKSIIDKMTDLWAKGYSATEIGIMIHRTRSQVLGKLHRLKLLGTRNPNKSHSVPRHRVREADIDDSDEYPVHIRGF